MHQKIAGIIVAIVALASLAGCGGKTQIRKQARYQFRQLTPKFNYDWCHGVRVSGIICTLREAMWRRGYVSCEGSVVISSPRQDQPFWVRVRATLAASKELKLADTWHGPEALAITAAEMFARQAVKDMSKYCKKKTNKQGE